MVKISNLVEPKNAVYFLKNRYDQIFQEISNEVEKIAKPTKGCIVTAKMECAGAECGSIFMEFQTKEDSENVVESFIGKNYESEKIKIVCVPEDCYVNFFLKKFENK